MESLEGIPLDNYPPALVRACSGSRKGKTYTMRVATGDRFSFSMAQAVDREWVRIYPTHAPEDVVNRWVDVRVGNIAWISDV